MIVGTAPAPTIAAGAHLIHHFADQPTDVRVGLATGVALLFEGDDYIGEPVNLAALAEPEARGFLGWLDKALEKI